VCLCCLTGIPFTSGFYSKDIIVERVLQGNSGWLKIILTYMSVGLTALYSGRVVYDLRKKEEYCAIRGERDINKWSVVPIRILGSFALFRGHRLKACLSLFSEYIYLERMNSCIILAVLGLSIILLFG
jgi:NADH:ubiquinone oxidoreductase subunit 5 (subunit L)/multisubunit Na+/H+ antiporter MnhA subunit